MISVDRLRRGKSPRGWQGNSGQYYSKSCVLRAYVAEVAAGIRGQVFPKEAQPYSCLKQSKETFEYKHVCRWKMVPIFKIPGEIGMMVYML